MIDNDAHSARDSPLLSFLDALTARGAEIRTRLRQLLPRDAAGDAKTDWLIGSMDIALEHHEAVERLVKSNLNGSAFSVVRLVFDTFLRSAWIAAYATDARMKQACRDKLEWPNMWKMRDEIKQAYFDEPCSPEAAALFAVFKKLWPIMCDYTHSGSRQIARRFTESELKPDYNEAAIVQAVNLTNFAVLLMTGMVFCAMGHEQKVEESATMLADLLKRVWGTTSSDQ
jgi:hypothetical protein